MLKLLRHISVCLLLFCTNALAATSIGTWNLEHLSIRDTKDFAAIAKVAKKVDFLAVQELMSEDALAALAMKGASRVGLEAPRRRDCRKKRLSPWEVPISIYKI